MKALVVVLFSVFFAGFLFADNAVKIDDFGCGVLDGNGHYYYTTDSRTTLTDSTPGVAILKCFAKNVANPSGEAKHFDHASTGLMCNTHRGTTHDWKETVSADGNVVLTCKVRGN